LNICFKVSNLETLLFGSHLVDLIKINFNIIFQNNTDKIDMIMNIHPGILNIETPIFRTMACSTFTFFVKFTTDFGLYETIDYIKV
jgi:hypothetical protein